MEVFVFVMSTNIFQSFLLYIFMYILHFFGFTCQALLPFFRWKKKYCRPVILVKVGRGIQITPVTYILKPLKKVVDHS